MPFVLVGRMQSAHTNIRWVMMADRSWGFLLNKMTEDPKYADKGMLVYAGREDAEQDAVQTALLGGYDISVVEVKEA